MSYKYDTRNTVVAQVKYAYVYVWRCMNSSSTFESTKRCSSPVNVMIEMFRIPEDLCSKYGTESLLRCVDSESDKRGAKLTPKTVDENTQAYLYWLGGYHT